MRKSILGVLLIQWFIASSMVSACFLDRSDFTKYIATKKRLAEWLLGVIGDQSNGPRVDLIKTFNKFENDLKLNLNHKNLPVSKVILPKGQLPKNIIADLIFVNTIEKWVPKIENTETACSHLNSEPCILIVKDIIKKFNLVDASKMNKKIDSNTKHCDF